MDLRTRYLGFTLPHPIVAGASPLGDNLDTVRRLEDAGVAAIVLRSLFREQITQEQMAGRAGPDAHAEPTETKTYFPGGEAFALGTDEYLEHLRRVKQAVRVPVFASLNGSTPGGWLEYASLMQQAGADGLELNLYRIVTNPDMTSAQVERQMVKTVREVTARVSIPVAVKVSPFFTAFTHTAGEFERAGADGLVLFNRFYRPDIDPEMVTASRAVHLSSSSELALRLHWTAILSGRVDASLAVTGGVHTAVDVIRATMAGAHVTQMVSALLINGPSHIQKTIADLVRWMREQAWTSLTTMRGNMNLLKVPDPEAYERANYMMLLRNWHDPTA